MPKINQEEYEILKNLDDKRKWIARNYNGALIIYTSKPMKNPNLYWDSFGERMDDRLFQFIQWEDESPYNIQELIEEYLYDNRPKLFIDGQEQSFEFIEESEETEVKDLQWMKDQLEKDYADGKRVQSRIKDGEKIEGIDIKSYWRGSQTANYIARCYLEDLDEPEVLSQEWIDENKTSIDRKLDGTPIYKVREELLQNLLVPKQEPKESLVEGEVKLIVGFDGGTETINAENIEEAFDVLTDYDASFHIVERPVVPKFVSSHIEHEKSIERPLFTHLDGFHKNPNTYKMVSDWYHENPEKYIQAWLAYPNIEIEQEPRYYAKIKGHENIGSNDKYWNYNTDMEELSVGDNEVHPNVISEYILKATKDEWANLGITDDNADFVKAEELEG